MWQNLAGCAVAAALYAHPASASAAQTCTSAPDQKHSLPSFINTPTDISGAHQSLPVDPSATDIHPDLIQKGTLLPGYINRRGELSLVGPSGILHQSKSIQLNVKPDSGHLLSFRMSW
jgi:hypothetical protein